MAALCDLSTARLADFSSFHPASACSVYLLRKHMIQNMAAKHIVPSARKGHLSHKQRSKCALRLVPQANIP